jgi:hypothetical protein
LQSVDSEFVSLRRARLSRGFVLYRYIRPYDRRTPLVYDRATDPGGAELGKDMRAE